MLRDVLFTVPAGATLGVVGATGSGKTSLIDLIPRIYDAQEGEILIDGIPVRELSIAALRREIGAAPQESLLFSDTIGSNLAYGLTTDGPAVADASAGINGDDLAPPTRMATPTVAATGTPCGRPASPARRHGLIVPRWLLDHAG